MNLEINIAKLPPVSPISTRNCKLFQNIELLTTPSPWYILAGGLLCFIKLTCLPISLSIYGSRQTCSVLTVRDPFFLCLSALVQSLVYFVIASLSVIWRREVVTLQPLSVFSLFSVFFSYLCPQLGFCEVNCFWCCQIGITAHTFISLFVYNIFGPYDLFIFFVRTKLLILEAKLASPVLIKKACYRLSIHVYVSPINYIKQLCLVIAFSISYNSLTWQEWHLLLIVLNWKPKDYWLKSLHTNCLSRWTGDFIFFRTEQEQHSSKVCWDAGRYSLRVQLWCKVVAACAMCSQEPEAKNFCCICASKNIHTDYFSQNCMDIWSYVWNLSYFQIICTCMCIISTPGFSDE